MGNRYVLATIIGLLVCWANSSFGQQRGAITQFMFNQLILNPAYAGSHDEPSVAIMSRHQWVGLEGAPSTQTISIHAPLKRNHIAVGATIFNDKIGVTSQIGTYAIAAYKIDDKNYHISFGLQLGVVNYNSNLGLIELRDPNDMNFYGNASNQFLPNVGAGIYYYRKNLYLGLSAPELIRNTLGNVEDDIFESKQIRHYYFSAGFVHPLSGFVKMKPNMLLKMADNAPASLDLNLSLLFNDVLWTGVSWRSFDSIDLILEAQISNNLRLGYAFDITTSELGATNAGTHEIVVNFRFKNHVNKMVKPKFF